jgi:cytochrome c-type biogenesis protein CcmH
MAALALAFVLPRLLITPRAASGRRTRAATNLEVYRSQIAEIDRDLAAGLLGDEEHRRARADIESRLLDETAEDESAAKPARRSIGAAVAIGLVLPALAFALYGHFGAPAAVRASAEAQASAAATGAPATRPELLAHLERNPRDGRAWVLLARADAAAQRYEEAAHAYAKAVEVSEKVVRDADIWCEYADALGMAQGGTLSGKPAELIARALAIAPNNPKALDLAGSAAYERRDYAATARYWRALLAQMPADSDGARELNAAIVKVEALASLGSGMGGAAPGGKS